MDDACPFRDGCNGACPTAAPLRAGAQEAARAKPPLRAVFMGTPEFAAVILKRLLACPCVTMVAAYCQPDRPAGRGRAPRIPAVKTLAREHGIPVEQPAHFKAGPEGDAAVKQLAAYAPDVLLVAAYGLVLPRRVLDIPKHMPINVHASLLPKYRGAAPIQRAVMNGDMVTGVTIMKMETGLDTGPILLQRAVGIGINDTSADLHDELAEEGAELLVSALERLSAGTLGSIPQDDSRASHAPKLRKEESLLDLSLPAAALHARIRAMTPWPGALLILKREGEADMPVQVEPGVFPPGPLHNGRGPGASSPSDAPSADFPPSRGAAPASGADTPDGTYGRILGLADDALLVACGDGHYAFSTLRPAGRKRMSGRAFFNGYLAAFPEARFSGAAPSDAL